MLLQSRKFLLLILDTVISLATYFVGKYAGADAQDILFVIGVLQPVFVAVIVGITVEDAAAKRSGLFPSVGFYAQGEPYSDEAE